MSRDFSNSTDAPPSDLHPQPPTLPGWLVIVVVGVIGFLGAGGAWLYHLSTQRRPVDFWGFDSHRIAATAPSVIVSLLEPEPKVPQPKMWHDGLFMIGEDRYLVIDQKEAQKRPGFDLEADASLRRYLRHDDSYDWQSLVLTRPTWRYALSFAQTDKMYQGTDHEEDRPFSFTLVFDADCRFVRLQMVDKTAVLQPPIAAEFARLFRAAFPGSSVAGGMSGSGAPSAPAIPAVPTSSVGPEAKGTGMAIIPPVPTPAAAPTPTAAPTPKPSATPTPVVMPSATAAPTPVPAAPSATPSGTAPVPSATPSGAPLKLNLPLVPTAPAIEGAAAPAAKPGATPSATAAGS